MVLGIVRARGHTSHTIGRRLRSAPLGTIGWAIHFHFFLVRSHPSQGGNVCLVQLHEDDFVLTHPAIACNAANQAHTIMINLDESLLAVWAAFIHFDYQPTLSSSGAE